MIRLNVGVALAAVLAGSAWAQVRGQGSSSVDSAVRAVLQSQVEAWNHHNLEQFMAGYWNSPELTFFSGTTETQGWEPTLERYRRTLQQSRQERGSE